MSSLESDKNEELISGFSKAYISYLVDLILKGILVILTMVGIISYCLDAGSLKNIGKLFNYYTFQTSIILGVLLSLSIILQTKQKKWKFVDMSLSIAMLWVLLSCILYHIFLADSESSLGMTLYASVILHYVVPVGSLIIYLFFQRDEYNLKWQLIRVSLFCAYPLLYAMVAVGIGAYTGFYPYWFLNPTVTYPEGIGNYQNILQFVLITYCISFFVGFVLNRVQKVTSQV